MGRERYQQRPGMESPAFPMGRVVCWLGGLLVFMLLVLATRAVWGAAGPEWSGPRKRKFRAERARGRRGILWRAWGVAVGLATIAGALAAIAALFR
jgi:hypothetical protein